MNTVKPASIKRVWIVGACVVLAAIITASTMMGLFSNATPDGHLAKSSAEASKIASRKKATKPRWSDLTPAQREALAPLAAEWDQINPSRKKKWLEVGSQIAKMTPAEKQRVQERIREWVALTPEQRRVARANYAQANKLKADDKFAQWQRYQQLTEEQKKELAAAGTPQKKLVANPPGKKEKNTKLARSIKSTPKPELEKSLQPAASPSPAPATPAALPPAPDTVPVDTLPAQTEAAPV